ncbi:MAG: HEPN domain-containing protein [Methanosarcinales archaeon]|nr:MAG: HEPN domain-containing protein [Methanosarcinales archaeon]
MVETSKKRFNNSINCKNSKDYYACAFFCQQSVEKGFKGNSLKAIYTAKKNGCPRAQHTH